MKDKLLFSIFFIVGQITTSLCSAQNITVVRQSLIYRQQVSKDSNQKMVELKTMIPGLFYDLRYATKNNFTGKRLYRQSDISFMRLPAAQALYAVQRELKSAGLGLKIFDAYRPYSVTRKMWDLVQDERYVANPAKGSGHNRGLAVDLTLIDLATGKELSMGTGFDDFSEAAHHDFKNISEDVLQNRKKLQSVMEKFGFRPLTTEWWHYNWPNDRGYDVLDLPFKKLKTSY